MTRWQPDPDWVSYHEKNWRSWLGHLAGKPHIIGLELGVYKGRSAVWWAEHILTGQGSRLIAVDVWYNLDDIYAKAVDRCRPWPIELRRTSSRRALADLLVAGQQVDFVYVDADHAAASCLADMCGAWHLVKPGGLMICDDYGWSSRSRPIPPKPAVDAWLRCYADRISGYEEGNRQMAMWKPNP